MKESIIMTHNPSDVELAKKYFKDYLTDDELNERQQSGRPWDIVQTSISTSLYILVDDETAICVCRTNTISSSIFEGESDMLCILPASLRKFLRPEACVYKYNSTSSPYITASTKGCNVCICNTTSNFW